jgi:hypothetical protein
VLHVGEDAHPKSWPCSPVSWASTRPRSATICMAAIPRRVPASERIGLGTA